MVPIAEVQGVCMRRDPFKGHRFPHNIILLAVHWYCRFPLSYQDLSDLLAARDHRGSGDRLPVGSEVRL